MICVALSSTAFHVTWSYCQNSLQGWVGLSHVCSPLDIQSEDAVSLRTHYSLVT